MPVTTSIMTAESSSTEYLMSIDMRPSPPPVATSIQRQASHESLVGCSGTACPVAAPCSATFCPAVARSDSAWCRSACSCTNV